MPWAYNYHRFMDASLHGSVWQSTSENKLEESGSNINWLMASRCLKYFFNHTWDDSLRFLVFLGWVKYQGHVGSSRSVNQPLVIVALTGDTWRRFSSSLLAWLQNLLACAAILIHLFWRIIAPIYRLTFFPI